jgi:hypothetical protein
MESAAPVVKVPATPEYVLAVLLEQARHEWSKLSCTPPDAVSVTLDSPLEVLCEVCDLHTGDDFIYEPMNWFGLDFFQWYEALRTTSVETTRDFCELIASLITMPRIPLVSICGQTCQPASVFLAVRSLLQDAGADVREIAPSTSLKEYTRCYTETFLGPIAKLAPGALPDVDLDDGGKFRREMIKNLWSIPTLIGFFIMKWFPAFFVFTLFIYLKLILDSWWDEKAPNARVDFGGLRTFRDLSELIAQRAAFQA